MKIIIAIIIAFMSHTHFARHVPIRDDRMTAGVGGTLAGRREQRWREAVKSVKINIDTTEINTDKKRREKNTNKYTNKHIYIL